MDLKLVKTASVREHMDAHYRGEISYSKAVELINEDAIKQLLISGVSQCALRNLLEDVRAWNNEWDKYDGTGNKPKSVDDYMEELNEKYVVGYTHCG